MACPSILGLPEKAMSSLNSKYKYSEHLCWNKGLKRSYSYISHVLLSECLPNEQNLQEIRIFVTTLFLHKRTTKRICPLTNMTTIHSQKPAARLHNPNGNCSRSSTERAQTFTEYLSTVFKPHTVVNTRHEEDVNTLLDMPLQVAFLIPWINSKEMIIVIKSLTH